MKLPLLLLLLLSQLLLLLLIIGKNNLLRLLLWPLKSHQRAKTWHHVIIHWEHTKTRLSLNKQLILPTQ